MSHAAPYLLNSTTNSTACDPALHTALHNCHFTVSGLKVLQWTVLDEFVAAIQQSAAGQTFSVTAEIPQSNPSHIKSRLHMVGGLFAHILFSMRKERIEKKAEQSSFCVSTHFYSTFPAAFLNWLHYTDNFTFCRKQFSDLWMWHNGGVNFMNACKKIGSEVETKQTHADKSNCSAHNSVIHHL